MPELPTGTVTFLFTDIEGSTRLLQELGAEAYGAALAEHRRVLREAFASHGGVEVDTQGDAFLFAFGDATDALAAAAEAQGLLATGPIRVRMGIHTGTPHVGPEGYVGQDVHLGARIAAAGHGGQVLLSKATVEALDRAVDVSDMGEHRVKDFTDPTWIYQLGSERFPPLKTISNTNLPRLPSSFIGRERQVAEVAALIRGSARLVTLSGPGGTGKTRLALEAASELVPSFRNGTFWVDLSPLRDPAFVLTTMEQVVGAKDGLESHIGNREMLLVVDNFEQVVTAAPELTRTLSACPNLRCLVTSRELLRVHGEIEYAVPPLSDLEAQTLFATRSGLPVDATIADLCRRLDSLPLAIELAAARTNILTPTQILERLGKRLDLFRGARDSGPRQRTLRATVEWSFELLNESERDLFTELSIFSGGWTLEAAEAVVDAHLDTLGSLVDKSLVQRTRDRFAMLETVRDFASDELAAGKRADEITRRHGEFFLAYAKDIAALANSDLVAFDRLEPDYDNVRVALAWCLAQADRTQALSALGSLTYYWLTRGYLTEGISWADRLLAAEGGSDIHEEALALVLAAELHRFSGDLHRALELKSAALEPLRHTDQAEYAMTLRDLGLILLGLGDVAQAEEMANQALAIQTAGARPGALAHARQGVAHVAFAKGDVGRAIALMEDVLRNWAAEGDSSQIAQAYEEHAEFLRRSGHLAEARASLGTAVQLAEETGDVFTAIWCVRGLGHLLADEREDPSAVQVLAAADAAARGTGMSFVERPSDHEAVLQRLRRNLGDEEFDRLWADGSLMERKEAEALAMRGMGAGGMGAA